MLELLLEGFEFFALVFEAWPFSRFSNIRPVEPELIKFFDLDGAEFTFFTAFLLIAHPAREFRIMDVLGNLRVFVDLVVVDKLLVFVEPCRW